MESKDRITLELRCFDLSRAMNSFKRADSQNIRTTRSSVFSIVRWYSPAEVKPIEATYVMAKLYEPGIGFICIGAAYEHGRFWELDPLKDKPLEIVRVLAWSYPPLDDRVDELGQLQYLSS
ncbi:MAG: hypothetical protein ACLTXL_13440 [Clostridia bacterium]